AVKVNRPDVDVRARKGYYADAVARTEAGAVSLDALSGELLPGRGIPLTVSAAPFRKADRTVVAVVPTRVKAAQGDKPGAAGGTYEPVEILTSAFRDGQKAVDWQRQRMSIAIPDAAPGELRYETESTLPLQAGTYELRVASRRERANLAGS